MWCSTRFVFSRGNSSGPGCGMSTIISGTPSAPSETFKNLFLKSGGEINSGATDARGVQPYLTHKLARALNAGLTLTAGEGSVEIVAG